MSTVTSDPRAFAARQQRFAAFADPPADQRITLRGLPWELYDALSEAIAVRQKVYLAYDGKDLEIMVKGRLHEHFKDMLGKLITAITDDLRIDCRAAGETTWKRREIARGLEADQCYFFQAEKLEIDRDAVKRRSKDIVDYPNPDLAVEIDLSPSEIDRQAIYVELRVSELWRFDGETVVIEVLENGRYVAAAASRFLGIQADEVHRWILDENADDPSAWRDRLRAWNQTVLSPRMAK